MPQHFCNKLAQPQRLQRRSLFSTSDKTIKLVEAGVWSVLNEKSGWRVKSKEVDLDKVEVLGDRPPTTNHWVIHPDVNSNTAKVLP